MSDIEPSSPASNAPDPPYEPPAQAQPAPGDRGARSSAWRRLGAAVFSAPALFAVLVVALALAWGQLHREQRALQEGVARRASELDAALKAATGRIEAAQEERRELSAKLTLVEARLAESQTQQAALEALYRELTPAREDSALAEVEQLLLLAAQQLQLAGNVPSALGALQAAEAKLQKLDRPQFVPLRKALTRDAERLKAVPFVDTAGIALRLEQVAASVDRLPFALDEPLAPPSPPPPAEETRWRRILRQAWEDLRQLVRVEATRPSELVLLTAEQRFFVRESLKLRLLSARVALLGRDQASFRADLKAAEELVQRSYDPRAKTVQAAAAALRQLSASELAIDLPDLSGSLEALRTVKLARERSAR